MNAIILRPGPCSHQEQVRPVLITCPLHVPQNTSPVNAGCTYSTQVLISSNFGLS